MHIPIRLLSIDSYIIFSLFGYFVAVDIHTPRGRVNIVLCTRTTLNAMELELDKSNENAMKQINLKTYSERFALYGLPMLKAAVSFDEEKDTGKLENRKIIDMTFISKIPCLLHSHYLYLR